MVRVALTGIETSAVVVLVFALTAYFTLTEGFVCGICLLGVHGLLLAAAALLGTSAVVVVGLAAGLRLVAALVLAGTVIMTWTLYLSGAFDHVGGLTIPTGMTIGASIGFLDRTPARLRVIMLLAGGTGVAGIALHRADIAFGFPLHQVSLLIVATLLLLMATRLRRLAHHEGRDHIAP